MGSCRIENLKNRTLFRGTDIAHIWVYPLPPPPPQVCSMAAFESLLILTANTFTGYIFLVSSKQGKMHFVFAN